MTITEFLLARIAEDEAVAEIEDGGLMTDAHFSRERVLAECAAKRQVVEWHNPTRPLGKDGPESCLPDYELFPCFTLPALALPYADHPDYQQQWRIPSAASERIAP